MQQGKNPVTAGFLSQHEETTFESRVTFFHRQVSRCDRGLKISSKVFNLRFFPRALFPFEEELSEDFLQ